MCNRILVVLVLAFAVTVSAQTPVVDIPSGQTKTFASSEDVSGVVAKLKSARKDGQSIVFGKILQLSPYTAGIEYRASVGAASVHKNDAELFYVIDGSATLVTGGKLVGEKATSPTNLTGAAIEGGESQRVAKGDFILIPENTPHWFSAIDGQIVLMSIHMPRGGSSQSPVQGQP